MAKIPSHYKPPEWGDGLRLESADSHTGRFQVDDERQVFSGNGRYDMTQFFRYPAVYETIIARLTGDSAPKRLLSLPASIGCEAYSLAALFHHHAQPEQSLAIDMADISEPKLRAAQTGVYPYGFHNGIPRDYRSYFNGLGSGHMSVRADIKNTVKALPAFNIRDEPERAGRYDMIVCLNLLCYLPDQEAKIRAVRYLASLLTAGGSLCLSHGTYNDFMKNHEAVTAALTQSELQENACFRETTHRPQDPPYKVVRFFSRPSAAPGNDL